MALVSASPESTHIPDDLSERLAQFSSMQSLVDSALAAHHRGDQLMQVVDAKAQLMPLVLPEPWRFVVSAPKAEMGLEVEVWQRQRLFTRRAWTVPTVTEPVQYIRQPRKVPLLPGFIGNRWEIDYEDPRKTSWIYGPEGRSRVKFNRGLKLAVKTIVQIEGLYLPT